MASIEGHTIAGTPHAGYSPAKDAPFACANCHYFVWPHLCGNEVVIKDGKAKAGGLKLHQGGKAVVEPLGCCALWEKA
jgi:hypothetical protein